MCLPPSSIDQIDREFLALLDAAEAAVVDAGWAALEPLAEAQGKVHLLEQQAARAIARHRDAVAYLHYVIVECGAERLPKRLLMSAAQYEEMYCAARKRAETRLADARNELAALAPKPKAAVQFVLAPKSVKPAAVTPSIPVVQTTGATGENDARHSHDRDAEEVVAPSYRSQRQLDSSAVRRRTRRTRVSLAQTIVGTPNMARGGRFGERPLRVSSYRPCAVLISQRCVSPPALWNLSPQHWDHHVKPRNTSMDYEPIASRDAKLSVMIGKLCRDIRDNGYDATSYGGCAGSCKVELSKVVGRKRTSCGRLEVKAFGPLTTMGPVPKAIVGLCAKVVVP